MTGQKITRRVAALVLPCIVLVLFASVASAEVTLCSNGNFSGSSGTTACDGSANPVAATATVTNAVQLTLDAVFGSPASSLAASFGNMDAFCAATPATGISCFADPASSSAVWYGTLQFSVRMSGARSILGTPSTARLTGTRSIATTVPLGQLLDGADGSAPGAAYQPLVAIDLKTGIPNGRTVVARSFGIKVNASDNPAGWSAGTTYSVVLE